MANKKKKEETEDLNKKTAEEKKSEVSDDKKSSDNKESSKEDELAKLNENLEKKDEEIVELKSHIQRLQADFDNFRKQNDKQRQDLINYANEGLIVKFLDVYEDMERALENSTNEEELREGLELIYSKMKTTLEKEGVEEIPAVGEKFDPFKHEALLTVDSPDHENNEIVDELMKGYTLKEKVIKYSKVRVCKKAKKVETEDKEE